MPLEGASLTSGFGMRDHPVLGGRRQHHGIDLAAPTGTPVYATADGVVGRADFYSSYGLYISISHGAAMETRYAHLSRLAVAAGDTVKKGDLIGYVARPAVRPVRTSIMKFVWTGLQSIRFRIWWRAKHSWPSPAMRV